MDALKLHITSMQSTKAAALVYYPYLFTKPFNSVTNMICKVLDRDYFYTAREGSDVVRDLNTRRPLIWEEPSQIPSQYTVQRRPSRTKAICAFRGCGKTTIVLHPYLLRQMLVNNKRFIIWGAANAGAAKSKVKEFRYWMERNELIKELFGDVRGDSWSAEEIELIFRGAGEDGEDIICTILARGGSTEQVVRGEIRRGNRVDLPICDDVENPRHIKNEDQRYKVRKWMRNEVMGAVDVELDYWIAIQIGNRQHQDSMLSRALTSPGWDSIFLPLCDENLKSLVPEAWTDQDVLDLYTRLMEEEDDGEGLITFYEEYMQNPVPIGADAAFNKEILLSARYEEDKEELWKRPWLETIVLVDPARTANLRSSDSAIVVVSYDAVKHKAYIRDIVKGKFHPDELYDQIAASCTRWDARVVGIEDTMKDFIIYPLQNYLIRKSMFVEVVPCSPRGGGSNQISGNEDPKIRRSRWLGDWYRQGLIKHHTPIAHMIEGPLLSWPKPSKWDVIDALSYLIVVLNVGNRYMHPDNQKSDDEALAKLDQQDRIAFAEMEDMRHEMSYIPLV